VAAADPVTGGLPLTGQPPANSAAKAVAIAPTPQTANAADAGGPETPSLFVVATLLLLGVPALVVMTLLATVLTRR
jgi:hypothetical protein